MYTAIGPSHIHRRTGAAVEGSRRRLRGRTLLWVGFVALILVAGTLTLSGITWGSGSEPGGVSTSPDAGFRLAGGPSSPFVGTAAGAGEVSLSVARGDTVFVGQYSDNNDAVVTAPTDSLSNSWHLVIGSVSGDEAIWNMTVSSSGIDSITFVGVAVNTSSHAGWAVEVANGMILASGAASGGAPPANPSSLGVSSVAVFTDFAAPSTVCDTTGGSAWVFGCANTSVGNYTTGMSQNVSAGIAPELDSNNSGGTIAGFVWFEIAPSTVPGAPTALSATPASTSKIDLAWSNPPGPLTGTTVYAYQSDCSTPFGSPIALGASNVSFDVTGLASGTGYCFAVTASNLSGEGPASATASATTFNVPPSAPTGLSAATESTTTIDLSWTNPSGSLTDDHVYEYASDCSSLLTSYDLGSAGASYPVSGLTASTTYCFEISASTNGGEGPHSGPALNTTFNPVPGAPTGLTAAPLSTSTIGLSWSNPTGTLVNDTVYDASTCSGPWSGTSVGVLSAYTVTGLAPGASYCFQVTAWTNGGESAASPTKSATTFNSPPGAPTGLTATTFSDSEIDLSWTNPSGTLTDNHVYEYSAACGSLLVTFNLNGVQTSYSATGLTPSTAYCFTVSASTNGGEGPQSGSARATTFNVPPAAPISLTAITASSTQIDLAWTNPSGALVDDHVYEFMAGCSSLIADFNLNGVATSYPATGLAPATTYCFDVTASTNGGEGPSSTSASATTDNGPPSPPTSLTATTFSTSQINLAWTNPSGSLIDNHVYEYAGAACVFYLNTFDLTHVQTSYSAIGLAASATYCFTVTASTDGGESANSTSASATTLNDPPSAPTGLTATPATNSQIDLSWTNPTGVLTDNHVLWGTGCGSLSSIDLGSAATSYNVTRLAASTSYCFEVSASTNGGAGPSSASATATTTTPSISLSETIGFVGTAESVSGSGFNATAPYTVSWDASLSLCTGTTDSSGGFSCTFAVPSSPAGTHRIVGVEGRFSPFATYTVTPSFSLNPGQGSSGTMVTATGEGFGASSTYTVGFDGSADVCSGTTDTSGTFVCAFSLPAEPGGAGTFTATQGSNQASTSFLVTPSVSLSSPTGTVGTMSNITGVGFLASVPYTVLWNSTANLCSGIATAQGTFSCSYTVPAAPAGPHSVTAMQGGSGVVGTFTVTPNFVGAPLFGPVGSTLNITGSGFDAGASFDVAWDGAGTVCSGFTNSNGGFRCSFVVPSAATGVITVSVSEGQHSLSLAFTVSASPPPPASGGSTFPWWVVGVIALIVAAFLVAGLIYEQRQHRGARTRHHRGPQTWSQNDVVGLSAGIGATAVPPSSGLGAPLPGPEEEPEDIDALIARLERVSQQMFKKSPKELGDQRSPSPPDEPLDGA
jgi:hypothetical protein